MKWIPISERKPENSFFMTGSCFYTDGNKTIEDWVWETPEGMTHWLDIGGFPPLPKLEKPKDEPAIGHFCLTPHKCFSGDVVSNVNEPIKMKEKPKDPDWEKLENSFNNWNWLSHGKVSTAEVIENMYYFLKSKYDRTE